MDGGIPPSGRAEMLYIFLPNSSLFTCLYEVVLGNKEEVHRTLIMTNFPMHVVTSWIHTGILCSPPFPHIRIPHILTA